ncbi:hypothetical protein FACS189492_1350 [Clostridia bacterium]|jgi:Fe-S-cluster containining protein|nr:hypothetical protein FACS189492_1350 [Clostridia bacterium]
MIDASLEQYRELKVRLDAKFDEIRAAGPASFQCRRGCHSCCKPDLTVNALEKEEIARFLGERPALTHEVKKLEQDNPHAGKRCAFLSAEGECRIYEVRPLVCRSHGAPLQFRPLDAQDENVRARDVCPLNFTGENLAKLPVDRVINLDTLNTLLGLLAARAFPGDASRTPLRPSKISSK